MSLNYELLGEAQAEHLRRQRLLDLEADHFRYTLDLEELDASGNPDRKALNDVLTRLTEVERRIALHRQRLGMPVEVTTADEDPAPQQSDAGSS